MAPLPKDMIRSTRLCSGGLFYLIFLPPKPLQSSHTYPGRIIIYKVKQKSTVDIFTWEQLAKGGAEIKEMDIRNHLDPCATENKSAWINGLKDYLEKDQASCSAKTR